MLQIVAIEKKQAASRYRVPTFKTVYQEVPSPLDMRIAKPTDEVKILKANTMGNRALKRRIASLRQRIVEHEEKIAAERTRFRPDDGLIRHWQVEIDAFNASLERALKRI